MCMHSKDLLVILCCYVNKSVWFCGCLFISMSYLFFACSNVWDGSKVTWSMFYLNNVIECHLTAFIINRSVSVAMIELTVVTAVILSAC